MREEKSETDSNKNKRENIRMIVKIMKFKI